MRCLIVILVFCVIFCEPNDFNCGFTDDKMDSLELYYTSFPGTVPVNCTSSFLPTITKVKHLKIRGYFVDEINNFIQNYPNVITLDISFSVHGNLDSITKLQHKQLTIFNASHSQLTFVGRYVLPSLTHLDLSYNNLVYLDVSTFSESKYLAVLNVSHNKISTVDFDIDPQQYLTHMDLSYNFIQEIDYDKGIDRYNKLKSLNLEENPIQKFDCRMLSLVKRGLSVYIPWSKIGHLKCTDDIYAVLDGQIEGMLSASNVAIELHYNERSFDNITAYEVNGDNNFTMEMMQSLTSSLKTLHLSGDFTGKLNTNRFQRFVNLEQLEIRKATISNFDFSWMKNQKRLRQLYVSKDSVKTMSNLSYLRTFEKLENVTVMENELQNMAEMFQHLSTSVKHIKVIGNFIGALDFKTFIDLDNLISLVLNDVQLSLSRWSQGLDSLQIFDISFNDLENETFDVFGQFGSLNIRQLSTFNAAYCNIKDATVLLDQFSPSLKELRLSGNQLGTVGVANFVPGMSYSFDGVEYLHLDNMNASTLEIGMLIGRNSLKFLNVSYNKMKTMNLDMKYESKSATFPLLEELILEGNDFEELEHLTPARFPKLRRLAISQNRLSCEYLVLFLQRIWREWSTVTIIPDPLQQKHGICTLKRETDRQKTTSTEDQKNTSAPIWESFWMRIAIGVIVFIIIIVSIVCFILRKRLCKKTTTNQYEEANIFWNPYDNTNISPRRVQTVPQFSSSAPTANADHIYEEIPDRGDTYDHLQHDTDPKPVSTKYHYDHLLLRANR